MARCRDCEALSRELLRLEGRVIALEARLQPALEYKAQFGGADRWGAWLEEQRKRREEKEAAELASRPTGDELTEAEKAGAGDAWMNE